MRHVVAIIFGPDQRSMRNGRVGEADECDTFADVGDLIYHWFSQIITFSPSWSCGVARIRLRRIANALFQCMRCRCWSAVGGERVMASKRRICEQDGRQN